MKPFVLLATRAEDVPADEEYALFLRYSRLDERELLRIRLEAGPMPRFDLDEISGIFVGGGPFNASDPAEKKSAVQHRVEAEFQTLLDEVVTRVAYERQEVTKRRPNGEEYKGYRSVRIARKTGEEI